MNKNIVRKGLVVGIILLFIVIGFKPVLSNEISLLKTSVNEADCFECQSIGKTNLAEKIVNRLEENEILSKDITTFEEFNSPLSDRPICDRLSYLYYYYFGKGLYYGNLTLNCYSENKFILAAIYLSMAIGCMYLMVFVTKIYVLLSCYEYYQIYE